MKLLAFDTVIKRIGTLDADPADDADNGVDVPTYGTAAGSAEALAVAPTGSAGLAAGTSDAQAEGTSSGGGSGLMGIFYGMDNTLSREAAQAAFLANFSAYELYGFEDIVCDQTSITDLATFFGDYYSPHEFSNGVTMASENLIGKVYSTAPTMGPEFPPGRYPTEGNKFADITSFRWTFDPPVAGVGFYLTDVGDFETVIRFIVTTEDGRTYPLEPCANDSGYNAQVNGNSVFFGVINSQSLITAVAIVNEDGWGMDRLDGYGIDSIVIALAEDVIGDGVTGYPTPWTYQFEGIFALPLSELADVNQFNTLPVAPYPTTIAFTDSEADSAAAGTFVSSGGIGGGGAYKNIGGARITGLFSDLDDTTPFIDEVWTFEGRVAYHGYSIGTGQIFSIDNWLTVCINASGELVFTVPFHGQYWDGAEVVPYYEGTISFTSGTLSVDTLTHWRIVFVRTKMESFGSPIGNRYQAAAYIDGVPIGGNFHLEAWDVEPDDPDWFEPIHIGHSVDGGTTPPAFGDVVVGGADGSNYALCTQCDVNGLRTQANEWRSGESFTVPSVARAFIPPPS